MTLHDSMVHYGPDLIAAQVPPSICPKCGSHRTEIVGRTETPPAIVVRCNACGERSLLPAEESTAAPRGDSHAAARTDAALIL